LKEDAMARSYAKGRVFSRTFGTGIRWCVAYCAPKDGRSAEVREVAGSTREDAERLLTRRMREVANARDGLRRFEGPQAERLTLNDLLKDVERDYEVRQLRSLRTAKVHMKRLRAALGGRRAVSVTSAVVQRYVLARRKEGAAPATIDRETELLRRAFAHAKETGRLSFAPHIPRQSRTHENARQGFLDRPDFDAILEKIADEDFRDYLEWFWWTGMRPGELASLTWNAYDAQTKTLRLAAEDAKTGQGRVVPVIGPLTAIIERREAKRMPACRLVFHSGGQRMTRSTGGLLDRLYGAWSKACEATGQGGLIPYDLRRTAVRNLRAAGIPERVAMEITGHKTRSMFDRYGIVDERDMRNAFEAVGAYVAALPKTRKVAVLRRPNSDVNSDVDEK
jgi:integrase